MFKSTPHKPRYVRKIRETLLRTGVLLIALLLFRGAIAQAPPSEGVGFLCGFDNGAGTDLFLSIDLATAVTTNIAGPDTVYGGFFGGDFFGNGTDSGDGLFYAISNETQSLFQVDPEDGSYVQVGTSIPLADHTWTGLAHNPADDQFYALSTDGIISSLYNMDITDASVSLINSYPIPLGIWLAINNDGDFFVGDIAGDILFSIDPGSTTATAIGSGFSFNLNFAQDADFDPATNMLYAASYFGGGTSTLQSIDVTTGLATTIGLLGAGTEMCAFGIQATIAPPPPPVASVPTMGQWGLILLSLIMLTLGSEAVYRRQLSYGSSSVSMPFSFANMPFRKSLFTKFLLLTSFLLIAAFMTAIAFGYQLTNADIPGSLLAIPLLAYLLHLWKIYLED